MKRIALSMLLMAVFAPLAMMAQETLTIYEDGTATSSNVPVHGTWADAYLKCEIVVSADQLESMNGGTISQMDFYLTTPAAEAWTGTFQVFLKEVDDATISSYYGTSDATIVYEGTLDGTQSTMTVGFSDNYVYGGGNLLIGVYQIVKGNWKGATFAGASVTDASGQGYSSSSLDGVSFYQKNFIPKTTFTYTAGSGNLCLRPTIAVSEITHNEATLTVGGGSGTYNVQYKAATATDWTDVATNTTETTFPLSGLTPHTAYDVQVQSVCDGGATSNWKTESFSTTAVAEAVGDYWSDDFEGTSCAWELVNGEIANAWCWGTTANNGGTHALYISNDNGTSNAYSVVSPAMVYATKLLNFTEGKYEFSFDWMAYGESTYDYFRVVLVPASVTLTAGTTLPSGFSTTAVPTGWIAVDGGSKLNLVTEWQNKAVAVNVPAGNYYLALAWRNDTSGGNQPPAAVDNVSITKLACAYDVTGLAVDGITANSATLIWNNSEVGQWQVAYADNASFDHATEVIVSDSTYTMSNLQPATTYYAKVRAYCGGSDFGGWSTEINLLTECVALTTYPYTENFDSYTAASDFLPICWDRINTGTSYNTYPYVNGHNAHSTSNCLYFYIFGSSGSTNISDQYAILPPMENLAGKQITLFARGYNNQSTFKIGTITDPTDVTTFTAIATQELTTSYQEFVYYVPATATDNYIAILMERPDASSSVVRGVYIDDISIDFPPACFKPTGLVASDPTAHGATLNWSLIDETQTAWDVQVSDTSDFSRVVVFEENVNSHVNYMLTGLNTETQYYVRVRGNCGAEDGVSEWSNTASFTTTIACPAPTGFAVATDGLSAYTATLKWTGISESYIVSYREPEYIVNGINETFGTSLPSGWKNMSGLLSNVMGGTALTNSAQWYFGNSNGVFDNHARINIYGSGSSERHGWLITPTFTLTSSTFTFDLALTAYTGTTVPAPQTNGTDDKFVVLISTDNMATWTILRQWDNEDGSTYVYNNIANTAEGEQVSIDLSSYVGQDICIAFYGESTETNADNNLHIDNVVIGNPQLIPATQWQTVTVDESPAILTGLTDETSYEAKVQGNCGDLDGLSEETSLITFTTLNTCPAPTNLTVVDSLLTATTAGLNWHGSIDVDNYTVRYRVPEHIEGGINETFEATSIPMDWAMYTGHLDTVMIRPSALTPATYGWAFGTLNGVFDNHARVNIYNDYQRWLVTPAFTLTSGTFTFDMALTKYSGTLLPVVDSLQQDDKFIVLISTDNMTTWTILREWNNSGSSYVYNNITCSAEGEQVSIDLSAYVGQRVRIAFYGESTNPTDMANTGGDNNLHIDNVIVGNPTVVPDSDWQTTGATATNLTLTGLTPETTYEAQVKSTCSDPEEWSNVVTFTTMVPVLVPEVTVSNSDQTVCLGDSIEDMIITATNGTITSVTGLPAGVEWSGTTISGTPTVSGTFNALVTVTGDQDSNNDTATADVTLTVNPLPEVSVSNNVQTVCMNGAITDMEITVSNGMITSVDGLPAGVEWSGTTISGAPTESGTFDVTVTVSSNQDPNCGDAMADITITVNPLPSVIVSNDDQTVCMNNAITDMEITAINATITSVTGLPSGVSWSGTTISGTPTVTGTFNVTVTVSSDQTPDCGEETATATITVNPLPEVTVTNNVQTICMDNQIQEMEIIYSNGTIESVTGLPENVNWRDTPWGATIFGAPAEYGTFNATVTVTSDQGCGTATADVTITVKPNPEVTVSNNFQTVCENSAITAMEITATHATIENVTGLPTGVSWSKDSSGATGTISGTPTASGTYNVTVTVNSDQTPSCSIAYAYVRITVNPLPEVTVTNDNQTVCAGDAIVAMEITATNGTIANVEGLPAGVTWSGTMISGTPTESGTFNVTVMVDSYYGCGIGMAELTIIVNPLPEAYTLDITGYGDSDGGWNLIASPLAESIAATEVGNLVAETASDFDLYRFNQAANMEWENWKQEESEHYHFNLESGQGYLYASKEDVTLIFTGEPYSDNGEVRLSKTTGVDFEGWNLVGNPFSDTAYIERPFYIMNSSGSEIIAAADVEQNSIAPMEGVFVIATEDGETLTFTTEAPSKSGKGLALNLSQGRGVIDRAIVRFGEGQQLPKFQLRESSTKVYIPQDNKDYAVVNVGRDAMHCVSTEIPVHFKARENGVYTLTVSETFSSQLSAFSYLHLIDNLTGNDVDLLETQSYTFEAKVTDYASRFKLVFATGDADNSEDFAFISNGNIIINGEGTLQVIDVLGRVIVPVDGRTRCVPTDGMAFGVYVLRLINGENVKTQKIVIK